MDCFALTIKPGLTVTELRGQLRDLPDEAKIELFWYLAEPYKIADGKEVDAFRLMVDFSDVVDSNQRGTIAAD